MVVGHLGLRGVFVVVLVVGVQGVNVAERGESCKILARLKTARKEALARPLPVFCA